ncbi:BLOC-1-related complex subunit 6 [Diabrotica undecimpunctata]|uniref:BLOC-1-related complex subunit 6 n=1 Tax=Diabrotica undecimpunctata TaxID=50387 RepID=UPI003B63AEA2
MEFKEKHVPTQPSTKVPDRPLTVSNSSEPQAEGEVDLDEDEISQQMTQSYSEISFKSGLSPENEIPMSSTLESLQIGEEIKRPMTLPYTNPKPLNLEGSVHIEGNMTHFVAEEIEQKIRLSSPVSKKDTPGVSTSRTCTPSPLYRQLLIPQVGQLDSALINDLEVEAHRMATSVDSLIENLCEILHSISSITADNVDVYKNAVSKMSDAMDGNIKSMYTMMAKAEEVTQSMKIVEGLSIRIKEIKRLVDLFESFV